MRHAAEFLEYAINTRGFTPATADTYAAAIADLERTVEKGDPEAYGPQDFDTYMTRKALAGAAVSTRRARANAIRSFFGFLHSRGFLKVNPAENFRPPQEKNGGIFTFTEEEVHRLIFFEAPPPVQGRREPALFFEKREKTERLCALRNSAIFGLSYGVGLRSGEVAGLRLSALSYDDKGACSISLLGKGAREPKLAHVDRRVAALLEAYLLARTEAGIEHPALFCPIGPRPPGSKETDRGINQTQVCRILERRIREAGIPLKGRRLTPHAFRYTRATHLYEANLPLPEIRDFLRHRSIETTMRYIRLGSAKSIDKRANAKLPWNRPKFVELPPEPRA